MKIGLFIPCYVDVVYPEVGIATYKLLKHLGMNVDYPQNQTCCGQPMANAGFEEQAIPLAEKFEEKFFGERSGIANHKDFDYVVSPSVSCTAFIRLNYPHLLKGKTECEAAKKTMDVVEFLHDVLKVKHPLGTFPHKVSLHNSCHGVRELGLSSPSEENIHKFNKIKDLLNLVEGIQILEPERSDECCGFGGMFSVEETAISEQMGIDKVQRHMKTGARIVTGPDCSCLMHMAGIAKKRGLNVEFKHVVEILAAGL